MPDRSKLQQRVIKFRDDRNWEQFHNPKDLAVSMLLESVEFLEHFQWKSPEEITKHLKDKNKDISDELADVLYWVLLIAHHVTLSRLLKVLKDKGYETYSNRHVDLFAVRRSESHLFEVKSFNKKNFRSQSRKGIVQLFEYKYFEIRQFIEESNQKLITNKILIYSEAPPDMNYINFINSLKMRAGYFSGEKLTSSGKALTLPT